MAVSESMWIQIGVSMPMLAGKGAALMASRTALDIRRVWWPRSGRNVPQLGSQAVWVGRTESKDERVVRPAAGAPGQRGGPSGRSSGSTRSGCRSGLGTMISLAGARCRLADAPEVDYHFVGDFGMREAQLQKKKSGGGRTRSSRRGASARTVDKVSGRVKR